MILALVLACSLVHAAPSLAARYRVVAGDRTEVVFESRAPLEKFTGRTDRVTGWLEADPGRLDGAVACSLTVDLASLDTGIGKRNRHMRENHLETDRFPRAVFTGGTVSGAEPAALPVGSRTVLTLSGTLDLHGVQRPLSCTVDLTRPRDDELLGEARFTVLLSEFAIPRPRFLVMKLADDQDVTVRLSLRKEP